MNETTDMRKTRWHTHIYLLHSTQRDIVISGDYIDEGKSGEYIYLLAMRYATIQ